MKRTFVAGLAVMTLLAAGVTAASARTHVDVHIGLGLPVYSGYDDAYAGGYYAPPPPVNIYVPPRHPVYFGYDEDSCAPVVVGYQSVWSYRYGRYIRRPVWQSPC